MDLEVVSAKWVRNGYELKLKRWPQDSVTKNNRSEMEYPHFVWHELEGSTKQVPRNWNLVTGRDVT